MADAMSSPTDDNRNFLPELENDVEQELAEDRVSEPPENPDGTPTAAWFEDPYLPRYEAGLRTLLNAVEGLAENRRPGQSTLSDPAP
jgi:hypothetical protein